jgi:sulfatase maturation enzyme AslB (radical SAM superfamily)
MSNSFCRYLTNGLRVQSWHGELAASPCCYIPQVSFTDPGYDKKFSQFHNLTDCQRCLYKVSGDVNHFDYSPNKAARRIPDVDHTHPVYAELSIDNECNAACLSCNDSFSSLWEKQNKKYNIKTAADYPDPQDAQQVVDDLFNQFNFCHLTEVNFFGGEPLISKTTGLVLNRFIDLGLSQNIQLTLTTNGSTRLTDHQTELLTCFKNVKFVYSIDGIGDRFHYLRYPLQWKKTESVIDDTRKKEKIKSSSFIVSMTLNPLNAFYVDELLDWANGNFRDDPRFHISINPCVGIMDLTSLPPDAVEYLCKKHAGNDYLINHFRKGRAPRPQFLEHLRVWDQRRNLDWKQTFPAAVPFFEKYLET